jgi:hypothetical protein
MQGSEKHPVWEGMSVEEKIELSTWHHRGGPDRFSATHTHPASCMGAMELLKMRLTLMHTPAAKEHAADFRPRESDTFLVVRVRRSV